jgi:hypothetical protein
MKSFIEKVFKMKKSKEEQVLEEAIEVVVKEVKKETKKEDVKPGIRMFPDAK